MKNEKYYVGLDIGTNSIGWAATDPNYNLLHIKRKLAWGVHLFEKAETAEQRRLYRTSRRRLARRRKRVLLLQDIFAAEITKTDAHFFLRLNNSKFHPEDRPHLIKNDRFPLFNDAILSEKEYFKKYPTIYHLQYDLIKNRNTKFDVRLLYLAIHHLIKYRGHFVLAYKSLNIENFSHEMVRDAFSKLATYFEEQNIDHVFNEKYIDKYQKIVLRPAGIRDLNNAFKNEFGKTEKVIERCLSAAVGATVSVLDIFPDLGMSEPIKFSFKDNNFEEEKYGELHALLGEEVIVIDSLKSLYDFMVISRLMEGETLFSKAMVEKYDTHKKDLKLLKQFVKKHLPEDDYYEIFKDASTKHNYPHYVGMTIAGKKKLALPKTSYEEFTKFLRKKLKNVSAASEILNRIDKGIFLPLQTTKDNAKIPYQFNEYQLQLILNNQSKYHSFLTVKDSEGITAIDKIMSILSFKIPYYVGPVVTDGSSFQWAERYSNKPVKPWNFEDIINIEKSAEKFISRMTNKCTYLNLEDVLPRESLLYEEYVLLNLLNSLKINNAIVDSDIRGKILNEIYHNNRSFTFKSLEKFIEHQYSSYDGVISLSGIDEEARFELKTRNRFLNIFTDKLPSNEILEKIVFYSTIFEDKKMYSSKIRNLLKKEKYSQLTINRVRNLTFTGWARLSKAFLTGYSEVEEKAILTNSDTGEVISVIDLMREQPLNLQQILYDERFNLQEALIRYRSNNYQEGDLLEEVQNLPLSPSVKRPIYRTLKMLEEITELQGGINPTHVMIETTRGEDENRRGKRTQSRYQQLQALYKNAKLDSEELHNLKASLDQLGGDYNLKPRKMFLYYLQMGRCMYTGKPIAIDELMTSAYDIDHILPQSYVKDDSLNNICLVLKDANMAKSDKYPLSEDVVKKMKGFWMTLLNNDMLSKAKFERLIRKEPLTDDEYYGFINRQLVEVSQANKAIGTLIEKRFPKTRVIYTRSRQVSDFRHKFGFIKVREMNKYHHAHDAYFNIVVGNYYDKHFAGKRFTKDNAKSLAAKEYNARNMFDMSFGEYWDKLKHLPIVKSIFDKKSLLVTRQPFIFKAEFYDQTIQKAGPGNLVPLKETGPLSDTTKYGGYSGKKVSHFAFVKLLKNNGKAEHRLVPITNFDFLKFKNNEEFFISFLNEALNSDYIEVLLPVIPLHSLLIFGKSVQYLAGIDSFKTFIMHNHMEPYFTLSEMKYFDLLLKANEVFKNNPHLKDKKLYEFAVLPTRENIREGIISVSQNIHFYQHVARKFAHPIYHNLFKSAKVHDTLNDNLETFKALNLADQSVILIELIKLMQTGALPPIDLRPLGFNISINRNRYSSNLKDPVSLLRTSLTGLKSKLIKLV